jgi:hypothetical protein
VTATGIIPRNRLRQIPKHLRYSHEYCFFLHDRCVQILREYESAKAHFVSIKPRSKKKFEALTRLEAGDVISGLRVAGFLAESRRVVINTIILALVSDCLHHIHEALRCLEKRKFVVAMNLLRKPLLDSLPYLSWMLGDEDHFYEAFSQKSPVGITKKVLGNFRREMIGKALVKTGAAGSLEARWLDKTLSDPTAKNGLYGLFQHAVHLVTVDRIELRTERGNFNFVFKNPLEDDLYESVYGVLPCILHFLSSVIVELFDGMKRMDRGSKAAFYTRALLGRCLTDHSIEALPVTQFLEKHASNFRCVSCNAPFVITRHNATRAIISDSLRCTACRTVSLFPFSWIV